MASKINKKYSCDIQGILDIREDKNIYIEVEDTDPPILLAELFEVFNNKEVKISITFKNEL